MEAIRIEILNSKALMVIQDLEKRNLVKVTKEVVEETRELPQWQKEIQDNRLNRANNPDNYMPLEAFFKEIEQEPCSTKQAYLKKMRRNAATAPNLEEITNVVEEVRAESFY